MTHSVRPGISPLAQEVAGRRPLHVLWINDQAAPTGGAERYVHATASELAKHAVRSSLLYDVSTPLDPRFAVPFEDGAFPLVDVVRQVAALDPDVIYVHRLADRSTLRELRQLRVPVVRFFHDHRLFCLREHKYTAVGSSTCARPTGMHCYACSGGVQRAPDRSLRLRRLGALEAEQAENRALDAFVVGSAYMAGHIAAHGFPRERIRVLPLFAAGPDAGHDTSHPREADLLLFVGQLVRGKGLDLLLSALQQTRHPVRLVVAGDGPQASMYHSTVRQLGLGTRVTFLGRVAADEVHDWYARVRAAVVPSRSPETFALAGLEAMRLGTPVIASRVGGIGEWLEEGRTGLGFPSGNARALAAAIDWLVDHPSIADAMGREARSRVARDFTPERHAEGLLGLLRELARERVQ